VLLVPRAKFDVGSIKTVGKRSADVSKKGWFGTDNVEVTAAAVTILFPPRTTPRRVASNSSMRTQPEEVFIGAGKSTNSTPDSFEPHSGYERLLMPTR
jgi:hypothetical protein